MTTQQQLFTLDNYDESKYTHFSFFWQSDSPFSQWHLSSFTVNNVEYNCAEQYMMHQKALLFEDTVIANKVMNTKSPKSQKALGRKVSNFDDDVWNRHCVDIVYKGNYAKFSQNEKLKETILSLRHKDRELVEASPVDKIWGIGMADTDDGVKQRANWKGKNLLGKILTCVRDELLAEQQQAQQ
jgi:ribA/ribD-fused uncharacterized protein